MPPEACGTLELAIGGVRFLVESPPGWTVVEEDPVYREFLGKTLQHPEEWVVSVDLKVGDATDVDGLPLLFDTEETWAAWRDGDDLLLRLSNGPEAESYIWQARLPVSINNDPPIGRITVHCGEPLREHLPGSGPRLRNPLHYPLDQLLLAFLLAPHRGLVCHAAGFERAGGGVLFAGRSGAGKTTISRWAARRPDFDVISDDRVVIRRAADTIFVHGTPWAGEGRMAEHRAAPLGALVFLHQAERNELERITSGAALEQLLPVLSILWFDRPRMEAALNFCSELVAEVPAYNFHFRPEEAALDVLDDLM